MTEPDDRTTSERQSFRHRRRPGIRYIYTAAAIVGGVILAIRFAGGDDAWMVWVALGLVILGLASIPVYRWMDKRRL